MSNVRNRRVIFVGAALFALSLGALLGGGVEAG